MKPLMLIAAFAAVAVCPAAQAGQLDMAKAGKLQCYEPKIDKKTCSVIAGFTFDGDGVTAWQENMLSPSPLAVLKSSSPVTFKGETICGGFEKSEIDNGTITIDGNPIEGDDAVTLKNGIWNILAYRAGKETCTTYTPSGDGYTVTLTLDGKPDGDPGTVIMIDPKDGYTVGP